MNDSISRSICVRPFLFRPAVSVAASMMLICAALPVAAYAQASSGIGKICAARANNARLIAQDRDAGISKEQEWHKTQAVVEAMPPQRQAYAQAELSSFIDGLYGRYAKLPPQDVYTKYLAYCEGRSTPGVAATMP
jgi:hypothetical protein